MQSRSEHPPTLLLERPGRMAEAVPDDLSVSDFDLLVGEDSWPGAGLEAAGGQSPDHLLASPGMALLAAVCILEGYKWIGAIPASNSRLSAVVFGRGGALVFCALATVAVMALARSDADAHRTLPQKLVVPAAAALVVSTVVLIVTPGALAKDMIGISDLALASALAGALFAGERRRRSDRRSGPVRGDSTERTLPVV